MAPRSLLPAWAALVHKPAARGIPGFILGLSWVDPGCVLGRSWVGSGFVLLQNPRKAGENREFKNTRKNRCKTTRYAPPAARQQCLTRRPNARNGRTEQTLRCSLAAVAGSAGGCDGLCKPDARAKVRLSARLRFGLVWAVPGKLAANRQPLDRGRKDVTMMKAS